MKNPLSVLLAACLLVFVTSSVKAQYAEDFRSREVLTRVYTDVKGSPYLTEDFTPGIVKLKDGKTFKDMQLKYDQVSGQLLFKDKNARTLTFADPVSEFKFTSGKVEGQLYRSGFKAIDDASEATFYQVLYEGSTVLLKSPKKNLVEHRAYNSSTAVKSVVETPAYYLLLNGQLVRIRKDKKSIITALGSKSVELDQYSSDQKLNMKDDQAVVKLIQYFDSIRP